MKIRTFYDKPKRKKSKIVAISVISVFSILLILLTSFVIFCVSTSKPDEENGSPIRYRMKNDFIDGDAKLVDAAMLGAHDAFANNIDKDSVIDPIEKNLSSKIPALRFLNDGLYNAQKAYPYELLDYGVRYFDVRLSRHNGSWHVKHAFIAGDVKPTSKIFCAFFRKIPEKSFCSIFSTSITPTVLSPRYRLTFSELPTTAKLSPTTPSRTIRTFRN